MLEPSVQNPTVRIPDIGVWSSAPLVLRNPRLLALTSITYRSSIVLSNCPEKALLGDINYRWHPPHFLDCICPTMNVERDTRVVLRSFHRSCAFFVHLLFEMPFNFLELSKSTHPSMICGVFPMYLLRFTYTLGALTLTSPFGLNLSNYQR